MVATLPQASTNQSILRDTRLAPFAPGRSEVRELTERFRSSLSYRGASDLKDNELMALAVASLSLGLNPFLGELWAIPGKGLMVGRAGWVKKLDENLTQHGITWWDQYLDIRPQEYEKYGIPTNAKLARLCELRRRDQIEAYITALERMRGIFPDLPYEQLVSLVGLPPVIRGVGYIAADEVEPGQTVTKHGQRGDYQQSTGYMSWAERAEKRAFAQACKKTVSLPFNVVAAGDIVDGVVIDAGYVEEPLVSEEPPARPEEPAATAGHWITDPEIRKRFWRFCKSDMKLSEDDVHDALACAHIEEFTGTMLDAKAIIQDYAREKWTAEGDGPEAA